MSRYNRQKGHGFEREIAAEFRELGFPDAKTTRAARGGDWSHSDDGTDLVGTGPYAVQCKRLASYASVSTIEEIKPAKGEQHRHIVGMNPDTGNLVWSLTDPDAPTPLLLTKANGKPTMAILPWEDLKNLIRRLED